MSKGNIDWGTLSDRIDCYSRNSGFLSKDRNDVYYLEFAMEALSLSAAAHRNGRQAHYDQFVVQSTYYNDYIGAYEKHIKGTVADHYADCFIALLLFARKRHYSPLGLSLYENAHASIYLYEEDIYFLRADYYRTLRNVEHCSYEEWRNLAETLLYIASQWKINLKEALDLKMKYNELLTRNHK